jgi:hypothetical protein
MITGADEAKISVLAACHCWGTTPAFGRHTILKRVASAISELIRTWQEIFPQYVYGHVSKLAVWEFDGTSSLTNVTSLNSDIIIRPDFETRSRNWNCGQRKSSLSLI